MSSLLRVVAALVTLSSSACAVETEPVSAPPADTRAPGNTTAGPLGPSSVTPTSGCPRMIRMIVDDRVVTQPALCDPRTPSPVDPPPDAELFEDAREQLERER